MPKVSVLILSYNLEAYIGEALDSVLGQDFQDFEIIVVDDASKDGTIQKIKEYTDPRIRLVCLPENGGVANGRNVAASHACGEYLAILDGDDLAHKQRLSRQVAFLDAHPDIDVLGSYYKTLGKPKVWKYPLDHGGMAGMAFFRVPARTSALMYRRSAGEKAGLYLDPHYKGCEDWDLVHQMLAAGSRFATLPESLVTYRHHAQNISVYHSKRNIGDAQEVLHKTVRRVLPDCTAEDLALHSAISKRKPNPLLDDPERVAAWLKRIYQTALDAGISEPDSFLRAMASQWDHICALYATQGFGVAAKRYFSQPLFYRAAGLSGHAAFFARCFKKWRTAKWGKARD